MWFELILLVLVMFFIYKKGYDIKLKYIVRLAIAVVVAILVVRYYNMYYKNADNAASE